MKKDMTYPNYMWKQGEIGVKVSCYLNSKHLYEHKFKTNPSEEHIKEHLKNVYNNEQ